MAKKANAQVLISIHAPHERCDRRTWGTSCIDDLISIHAPRSDATSNSCAACLCGCKFQSTHRVAMRLDWLVRRAGYQGHFNPRTAWAMRQWSARTEQNELHFNPRTAWAMRRASRWYASRATNFNPRTAWAMRLFAIAANAPKSRFQSTHRVSDATIKRLAEITGSLLISIHAPRERCDTIG